MSLPSFYDPGRVGTLFVPDVPAATVAGMRAKLTPSKNDSPRTLLLLVDPQVDFVHADGALSVPGAVEDTRRLIEWIFSNTGRITTIATSLDSHVPIQIFFPTWWQNERGEHPAPYTVISAEDVELENWIPTRDQVWSQYYVESLEGRSKKQLMIWPYHTLIGTPGQNITPALYEAVAYHTAARNSQPVFLNKGAIPRTEYYSMLEPEVKVPDEPNGELNVEFLYLLATYDRVYIAGQAKSHCVLETVNSIVRYFADQPEVIAKLHILTDCMSAVAHPAIDFDAQANEALARLSEQGVKLSTSEFPVAI